MFAFIEIQQATHIAIAIPHDGADKSIPALVKMLENNATFIQKSYGSIEVRQPKMSIELGDTIEVDFAGQKIALKVPESNYVLDDSFVHCTPEILTSSRKAIEERDEKIRKLTLELGLFKEKCRDMELALSTPPEEDS